MNPNQVIHETILRDLVDVATGVANSSEEIRTYFGRNRSWKSINQATSALVLTFPVLCSKQLSISTATMISKAIERQATSLLQILFSAIQIDDAKDAIEYVKQYHTNINMDTIDIDSFSNAIDSYINASASVVIDQSKYDAVMEDLKNISFEMPPAINETSINSYKYNAYGKLSIVNEAPRDVTGMAKDIIDIKKSNNEIYNKQLLTSDVKKANELTPTLMTIRFISTSGEAPIKVDDAVIGIKAKLIPIDSDDIIKRIIIKNQDNNGLMNLIKAGTREISFWKDFVFAIDRAKIDAISHSKRGSSNPMWKVLERRSLKSRIRRTLGNKNDASAISTLVISQEEVEYLKKTESIDMEKAAIARPIMESYNLMGLVIADEAMETAKFMKDTGDASYETLSFSNLEKEASDTTYKKVVNLMTKLS